MSTGYQHLTSGLAWNYQVKKNLTERQKPVYELLLSSPEALTNKEISERLHWDINRVTPRTGELLEAGLICRAERRNCRVTGNRAWELRAVKNSLF